MKRYKLSKKSIRNSMLPDRSIHETSDLMEWFKAYTNERNVQVTKVPITELKDWHLCSSDGFLTHKSSGFFSLKGLIAKTSWFDGASWDQPIIHQNEIGILGILVTVINGTAHFLMQAKIEPGNINKVQLSPTVQATKSNYQRRHGGAKTPFIDLFLSNDLDLCISSLQTEHGGRFYKKLNRNIIKYIDHQDIENEHHKWMTLNQISIFLSSANTVNMDTRSVLSLLPFLLNKSNHTPSKIRKHKNLEPKTPVLEALKLKRGSIQSTLMFCSLTELKNWHISRERIENRFGKFFSIIGVDVKIDGREVSSWDQPMIEAAQPGICGLLVHRTEASLEVLIQFKYECGLFNSIELAPTVQALTGGKNLAIKTKIPYIINFIEPLNHKIIHNTLQSEEGGRFYQEENLNIIVEVSKKLPPENNSYAWLPFETLVTAVAYGQIVNVQLRSLIVALWFYEVKNG
ncbi:NDP-hexose 2,3-dehydratase family protein [Paracoccaceae bacterium]|nr:NDP-hexose 2,3-dehydratase family protein [Paracoccaceae bacterium]